MLIDLSILKRVNYYNLANIQTRNNETTNRSLMFEFNKKAESDLEAIRSDEVNQVFDQYFSDVYKFVLFRVGDTLLAEDISSETFLRLLETVQKRDVRKSKAKGWLFTTASHIIMDHLREKYKKPQVELEEHVASVEEGVVDQVAAILRDEHIRENLATLSMEQQEVLNLRFNLDYSIQETAELMGKNENAIKQLQYRAITTLKNKISVTK